MFVLFKLDELDSSWGFRAHATTGVADTERMKTEPLIRSQKQYAFGLFQGIPTCLDKPISLAVGSIGNTTSRPFGQDAGADQLVVDPLLLLVQVRVQHVVGLMFPGEHGDGVPVVTYRLEHCATSTRLVKSQVIGKVKVGNRAPSH
jgi:hypothetical protein